MNKPAAFQIGSSASIRRRGGKVRDQRITLSHGSGGKAMRDLIDDVFVGSFDNPVLEPMEDQARFRLADLLMHGDRLAFSTDSYVVDPLFFPGGDIGTLAVNGTVNDLAVSGAKPLFLSCAMILEEGLDVDTLRRVAHSMRDAAKAAGVTVVTGDTKVVPRGKADKLFINTAGIGVIPKHVEISANHASPGDAILVNGLIGDHGAAILNARGDLALETTIESHWQPMNRPIDAAVAACPDIHCLRDATRGGVATVLNVRARSQQRIDQPVQWLAIAFDSRLQRKVAARVQDRRAVIADQSVDEYRVAGAGVICGDFDVFRDDTDASRVDKQLVRLAARHNLGVAGDDGHTRGFRGITHGVRDLAESIHVQPFFENHRAAQE